MRMSSSKLGPRTDHASIHLENGSMIINMAVNPSSDGCFNPVMQSSTQIIKGLKPLKMGCSWGGGRNWANSRYLVGCCYTYMLISSFILGQLNATDMAA